jgi:PAS domain S-box-containing protein
MVHFPDVSGPGHKRLSWALAKAAGTTGILGGVLVWALSASAREHPSYAIGFILAGLCLFLAPEPAASSADRRAWRIAAAALTALGLWGAVGGGLHPGAFDAPALGLGFALIGGALFLLDGEGAMGEYLSLAATTIAMLALLGSLYGVDTPYVLSRGRDIPAGLALILLILCAGTLGLRPNRGWLGVLTGPGAGGSMARRLLPAAVLVPALLGWLKVWAVRAGYPGVETGPIIVLALILVFIAVILVSAEAVGWEEEARRLVERELRQVQRRLEAIADNTTSVILLKDLQGRYLFANRALERITGRARSGLLGKTARDIFPGGAAEALMANDAEAMAAGGPVEFEEIVPGKDGARIFLAVKFPVSDASGRTQSMGVVAVDITERRRLEDELRRTRDELQKLVVEKTAKLEETGAQLIQAQKMEAVGRLAGGVAHDFNNLLTAIFGFTELLLMATAEGDPRTEDLLEIQKAGKRGAALTRQLLAFSRRQLLQPVVLELNDVVSGVQKMLSRLIGEDIRLVFLPGGGVGRIKADPGQLEQVLMNLVVNARDAMPQGGTVTLTTSRSGPRAVLAVADTGSGMDEHVLAHLYEPFFTTKEMGKGTGLGLSTVYGIVKQSGGTIDVDSAVGRGTAFRISFPSVSADASAAPSMETGTLAGTETVLLAEDDGGVRGPVTRFLTTHGYTVLAAGSGEEALRLAERDGTIDILLTDVVMPRMRGDELARLLVVSRPGLKVIYMTGYVDERSARLPADRVLLQKPIALETLARRLREVLDRR